MTSDGYKSMFNRSYNQKNACRQFYFSPVRLLTGDTCG